MCSFSRQRKAFHDWAALAPYDFFGVVLLDSELVER